MKTLRLLLWLRWRLFIGSGTAGTRWAAVGIGLVLFLAFSPLWAGGAVLAWAGVHRHGSSAIAVTFGVCQLLWLWMGLVSGALGRTFELDKFLRYPVHPRSVFAINVFASLLEPVCLMTIPALAAVAWAAGERAGLGAGIATAFAALLLSLLSATALQVLLALLDELLRREATRYVAGVLLPLTFLGVQLLARTAGSGASKWLTAKGMDVGAALDAGARALSALPTIGGPAGIATGVMNGQPLLAAGGLVASVALLALGVLPAAALMRHVVRAGESAGAARPAGIRPSGASFGCFSPPLSPVLGALLARELRYSLAHPQRVASVVSLPLMVIVLRWSNGSAAVSSPAFLLGVLLMSVAMSSLLLFGFDGPGVRSFYLLPCPPRDVVLSKNLEFLLRIGLELALAVVALTLVSRGVWSGANLLWMAAGVAVLLLLLTIGTSLGIRFPMRARRRGTGAAGGGPGFWRTMALLGVSALIGAVVFGGVWAARIFTPAPWASPAAWSVATVFVALAAAIWWRSLDVHATLVTECRDKIIAEVGRSDME
ncbi:MAG: hypothetical protein IT348_09195 [Candidatus Eisenbacteria bacterium]|nr:hypothetical protein [Candidatus Eisenbacteria bacterium]